MNESRCNVWVFARRDEDRGVYVARCLDMNVEATASSFAEALQAAARSASLAAHDSLTLGQLPLDRRAPREEWDRLYTFLRTGEPLRRPMGTVLADPPRAFACQFEITSLEGLYLLESCSFAVLPARADIFEGFSDEERRRAFEDSGLTLDEAERWLEGENFPGLACASSV